MLTLKAPSAVLEAAENALMALLDSERLDAWCYVRVAASQEPAAPVLQAQSQPLVE